MFRLALTGVPLLLLLGACSSTPERGERSAQALRISEAFQRADANGDEQLSRDEFAKGFANFAGAFDDIDVDSNGTVNLAELQSYMTWARVLAATDKAREIKGRGGRYSSP